MRDDLPTGTVTFLFTDVEGSTRLLHELGTERYAEALAEHRQVVRESCASSDGVEVDTQGDAFFFAFPTAPGALAAAAHFTQALSSGLIRVRVGLHTGTPLLTEEGYVGGDVHRAARIAAAGHGGQVLVSSSTAELIELELTDLGEHRLKDLSAPERIYQLGDGEFPALKSLYRTNLPIPATAFLGREQELAEVLSLLFSEDTRLLTLTGPGGTGKTRLALQAVAEASDRYPDGVWWIPLAPLRASELVLETAAQVVGSKNGLAEHIQDKAMLCLFDNFEQVVEAGGELASLLASCPNLDIVVTSRERLRVTGEQTYPVPPLAAQDGEALFSARARAVDPSFASSEAVAELCLRLDELPLALELAAARTALFSPEQLLERLSQRLDLLKGERDADPRQQTLRTTIEWSHDLLTPEEQELFARLSVFAGGCSYEAAEEVCDADPDTLQSLLDKSLLRKRESGLGPRYWMLETIREFALGRLDLSTDADELRRRHAEYFLAYSEEVDPRTLLGSADEKALLDRIGHEHDNIRVALDFFEETGESEHARRLTGAMWPYWALRGPVAEGQRRLESALGTDERPTAARALVLTGLTSLGVLAGDALRTRVAEELAIYEELGDSWGAAHAVFMLGHAAAGDGDDEAARNFWDESLARFREVGDEHFVGIVLDCLSWAYCRLGDLERAQSLAEENLGRARATSNKRLEGFALDQLAMIAVDDGRAEDALFALRESFAIQRVLDLPGAIEEILCYVAAAAAAKRPQIAARLLSAALSRYEEIGVAVPFWAERRNEQTLSVIRQQLDEDAFDRAWDEGRGLALDEAVALGFGDFGADV